MTVTKHDYGTFILHEHEFGIKLENIQELVEFPANVLACPMELPYFLGLFELRGQLVPIIDLSARLKLDHSEIANKKILIIRRDHAMMGLVIQACKKIIHVADTEVKEFYYAKPHQASHSLLEQDAQHGMTGLLDVDELFECVSMDLDDSKSKSEVEPSKKLVEHRGMSREKFLVFISHGFSYALPVNSTVEILLASKMSDSKFTDALCKGRLELRGLIIPVIQFRSLLTPSQAHPNVPVNTDETLLVIIKHQDQLLALLVEKIQAMIVCWSDEIIDLPHPHDYRHPLLSGMIYRTGRPTSTYYVVEVARIFQRPDIIELIAGHKHIYPVKIQSAQVNATHLKDTYVTFNLETLVGFPIASVQEIISYENHLIESDAADGHYKGNIDLRGVLIPVFDLATDTYAHTVKSSQPACIVIIQHKDTQLGLIVHQLESIVRASKSAVRLPVMLYPDLHGFAREDIVEVIKLDKEGFQHTIAVLNVEKIIPKLASNS